MNDDRLTGLLGSLRQERMDRVADDRVRARLEHAWTAREARRSWGYPLRRLAPIVATLALVAGLAGATMNASGDSVLYGVRIAVEDAALILHPDLEDRNEYLLALFEQRQSEAARLESSGNALAAARVREIEQQTLRQLEASLPKLPDEAPVTAPIPSGSPTPSPSASPTQVPTPVPTPSLATSRTPTPTPRPTTPPPARTPTPTAPPPTGTPFPVTLTGNVKDPDLTLANGACVSIALPADFTAPCDTKTSSGTYRFTISARVNQSVTVYAWRYDATTKILYKGSATAVIRGSTVAMPDIKLAK